MGNISKGNLTDNPYHTRLALTICYLSRWLHFEGNPDYKVIQNTGPIEVDQEFIHFLKTKESHQLIDYGSEKEPISFYSSTKAGPNGPALMSALWDLKYMEEDYKESLKQLTCLLDPSSPILPVFDIKSEEIPDKYWDKRKDRINTPRKLTHISDKEGKQRIIAIPDYWTQCTFKSIHKTLNKVLKGYEEDCTFNQDNFRPLLVNDKGETKYSIDLKTATELMPANWQAAVLEVIFSSKEISSLWLKLLTEFKWTSPVGDLYFRRGQPMGVYSSWPAMAITHHLLVRWALTRKGLSYKNRYALLGDDLLIVGDEEFNAYKEVVEISGLILNESKTFQSKVMFEFAKRFFYKGIEISPFPVGAVMTSNGSLPAIAVALDNACAKSWLHDLATSGKTRRGFLEDIIQSVAPKSPSRLVGTLERMMILTTMWKWLLVNKTDMPNKLGYLGLFLPCNRRNQTIKEQALHYLSFLLYKEANKKSFSHLQSVTALQMELMMSPLATNYTALMLHPAIKLGEEFQIRFSNLQNIVLEAIGTQSFNRVKVDDLLDLTISPVPTLKALYREESKASIRRVQTLGALSRDFIDIWNNHKYTDPSSRLGFESVNTF